MFLTSCFWSEERIPTLHSSVSCISLSCVVNGVRDYCVVSGFVTNNVHYFGRIYSNL